MNKKSIRETITFSCDPGFKELITTKVNELGYHNTSQMIRDALQNFFESEEVLDKVSNSNTEITVIISVVYDHNDRKTTQKFIEAQHHSNVAFSSHFHMKKNECLEILMINNTVGNVRLLLKKLRAIDGIRYISGRLVSRA